jgi:predicted PurR-regulated permease PerM
LQEEEETSTIWEELLGDFINFNLFPVQGPPGSTVDYVLGLITNGLVLLFVGVILLAIVFSALAGIKFIRSQGEAEKVEEAQEAIKNVLIGVASVFIGVIGIIVITGIFTDDQEPETLRRALCIYVEPQNELEDCVRGSN